VATPMCVGLTLICWVFLIALYRPNDVEKIPAIVLSKAELSRSVLCLAPAGSLKAER
jgi:hypothetical protein